MIEQLYYATYALRIRTKMLGLKCADDKPTQFEEPLIKVWFENQADMEAYESLLKPYRYQG